MRKDLTLITTSGGQSTTLVNSAADQVFSLQNLPERFPAAKAELDQLLFTWLSLAPTQNHIRSFIEELSRPKEFLGPGISASNSSNNNNNNSNNHLGESDTISNASASPSRPNRKSSSSPSSTLFSRKRTSSGSSSPNNIDVSSPQLVPSPLRGAISAPLSPLGGEGESSSFLGPAFVTGISSSNNNNNNNSNNNNSGNNQHLLASTSSQHSTSTTESGNGNSGSEIGLLGSPLRTPPTIGQYLGPRRNSTMSLPPVAPPTPTLQSSIKHSENLIEIPTFYIPGEGGRGRGRPNPADALKNRVLDIENVYRDHEDGIELADFPTVCKDLCGFPVFLNAPLFRRIRFLTGLWNGTNSVKTPPVQGNRPRTSSLGGNSTLPSEPPNPYIELESGVIELGDFMNWWSREYEPYDEIERIFRLIKSPESNYIVPEDLIPILQELLDYHPGLEFLENTPEFQEKYARTVIARIFYKVNTSMSGKISLRELRKSDLVHFLHIVDEEEEINAVNEYFSYEHFYCLYCRFWELDTDHDLKLSKEDLIRYGNHSLTRVIVQRIFDQVGRTFTCETKNKMGYEDFVFFCLAEEDKTTEVSLRYWFRMVDLDGDGRIMAWEMEHFYEEQFHRMQSLGQEEVPFLDVVCQMFDCVKPKETEYLMIDDFLKPDTIKTAGVFFNLLFSLNKFIAYEQRDPFALRQQAGEAELTDWDRFCLVEYARLASAEERRNLDVDDESSTSDYPGEFSNEFDETTGLKSPVELVTFGDDGTITFNPYATDEEEISLNIGGGLSTISEIDLWQPLTVEYIVRETNDFMVQELISQAAHLKYNIPSLYMT